MLRDLGQCCVAALALDGPGRDEMGKAVRLLRGAGAEVQVVSAAVGCDRLPMGGADPDLYDAVLLPCAVADLGQWGAGREDVAFVEHFLRSGKLVLGFGAAALDGAGDAAHPSQG